MRVCICKCTGRRNGSLPGRFLRWPEKGCNQVQFFLEPNQRITTKKDMCSPPPLNLTSIAGHRLPIKPGLGGYLHTGLWQKSSWTSPIPPCSLHKPLFIILLSLSFLPSFTLFHFLLCLYPPLASSFQNPVSSSHKGASRNYSFCRGSSANSQYLMPTAPLFSGSWAVLLL